YIGKECVDVTVQTGEWVAVEVVCGGVGGGGWGYGKGLMLRLEIDVET
ncbi:hypothetical protein Tco_0463231, partial [Tanacetum coccineum]